MKKISAFLALALLFCLLSGCATETQSPAAPASEPEVLLRVSGAWPDCQAMEWAATAFTQENPSCTVVYEYLQGDYTEVLKKRMLSEGDDRVDLFITTSNIQDGHDLNGTALDMLSCEELDLSNAFPSIVTNAMYIEPDGSPATKLYSLPLGTQMRGLYINLTLLQHVGIDTAPANQAELLADCEILKQAGYVPFHGDPSPFTQQLLYPWICNCIANADDPAEAFQLVNSRDIAATELFRDVYEFLYNVTENDYYNYKYSQGTLGLCADTSNDGMVRSFLNIFETAEGSGEYEKLDDIGQVAFMPNAISLIPSMDKTKEDYHSGIEYVFVPAPVGPEGGYVYLSPADMIGINKDTEKLDWAVKFLNFLFVPENNEAFAEKLSVLPNTVGAMDYVSNLYDVPKSRISELGQATFDWNFYRTITRCTTDDTRALPAIAKANAPKYLDPATGKMYPFEHFWEQFQMEFTGEE